MKPLIFRKKPLVVIAIQLTADNALDITEWSGGAAVGLVHVGTGEYFGVTISTPEGEMRAEVGDWIIKGVMGEFYPCKADIFSATYEAVEP